MASWNMAGMPDLADLHGVGQLFHATQVIVVGMRIDEDVKANAANEVFDERRDIDATTRLIEVDVHEERLISRAIGHKDNRAGTLADVKEDGPHKDVGIGRPDQFAATFAM